MQSPKSIVIINLNVAEAIINHAYIDEFSECGGYLLGKMKNIQGVLHFYIEQIYYEKNLVGSENEFVFPLLYESRAKAFADKNGYEILGTYHSHGQYTSAFSDVDKNVLEPHWASDKICLIFSPKYFTFNCDTVFKNKETEKTLIIVKDGKKYMTIEKFFSQDEQLEKHI